MLEEPLDDNGQPFPDRPDEGCNPARPHLVNCDKVLALIDNYSGRSIPRNDLTIAIEKLIAA